MPIARDGNGSNERDDGVFVYNSFDYAERRWAIGRKFLLVNLS